MGIDAPGVCLSVGSFVFQVEFDEIHTMNDFAATMNDFAAPVTFN